MFVYRKLLLFIINSDDFSLICLLWDSLGLLIPFKLQTAYFHKAASVLAVFLYLSVETLISSSLAVKVYFCLVGEVNFSALRSSAVLKVTTIFILVCS